MSDAIARLVHSTPPPTGVRSVTRRVRVEPSVEEMLLGADDRVAWKNANSLSGSRLERLTINGERFVLKYICVDDDWIMRATGDLHSRQLTMLQSGLLDELPEVIDHTIVACAPYTSKKGHRGAALLMRDVSEDLVPTGERPISMKEHRQFLAHMALLHATYLGFVDTLGLSPLAHTYVFLTSDHGGARNLGRSGGLGTTRRPTGLADDGTPASA